MHKNLLTCILMCLIVIAAPSAKAAVIYVDSSATGTNNGQSWTNAYTDLQSGLLSALPMDSLWVAKGTYYPTSGSARNVFFTMVDSVKLLGGFAGTEVSACERDWIANPTILSADIGIQGDSTDNSYHVVYAWQVYEEALLDGFVLRDGNADVSSSHYNNGGGLHMEESEFPVRNCLFRYNSAINAGGGLYMNQNQQFLIEDCIFEYNFCPNGGGMYANWAVGRMSRCTFRYNKAGNGAGGLMSSVGGFNFYDCIFHDNLVTQGAGGGLRLTGWSGNMINCRFERNTSRVEGGGMAVYVGHGNIEKTTFLNNVTTLQNASSAGGGGFFAEAGLNAVRLTFKNCSFIGNISGSAGGGAEIYSLETRFLNTVFSGNQANLEGGGINWGSGTDSLRVFNCTFANNVSGLGGGGIFNYNTWHSVPVWNCIFYNNVPNQVQDQPSTVFPALLEHCIVTGGYPGTANLNVNPMFLDADGTDNIIGTEDDDLRLMVGSPAIQAGKPDTTGTYLPATDHKLEPRIVMDTVDIGAFEGAGCQGNTPVVDAGPDVVICGDSLLLNAVLPPFGCAFWLETGGCYRISNPYSNASWVTFSEAGTHTLIWEVNYCDTLIRDTLLVTNHPVPESPAIVVSGNPQFCTGDSTQLSLPGGYAGYLWNTGDTTQQITVDSSGSFTAQVITAAGCLSPPSAPLSTTELPLPPSPVISPAGPLSVCQNTTVTLAAPGGYAQYSWSNGGSTQSINPLISGSYSLFVVDTNGCQSPNSSPVSLTFNPNPAAPVVQVTGNNPICTGDSLNLQGPSAYVGYVWSNGGTTANIAVSTAGTYTLQVTDTNGCQSAASAPVSVQVFPLYTPAIASTGDSIACPGESFSMQGPSGLSNYQWSNGATGNNTLVTTPGTYTLTLTDQNGCPSATSNPITFSNFPAPPQALISPVRDTLLCEGDSVAISVSPSGLNYLWSNGQTTSGFWATDPGNFSVTITDQNGCVSNPSDTVEVSFQPQPAPPQIVALSAPSICEGDSVVLEIQTPLSNLTYIWSNSSNALAQAITTSGDFRAIVQDSLGCKSDSSNVIVVTVFPSPPRPAILLDPSGEICQGDSVVISGPANYQDYIWNNGSQTQSIVTDTGGSFSLQVIDSMGCISDMSAPALVELTAVPLKPELDSIRQYQVCTSDELFLQAPPGYQHYLWSNGATSEEINVSGSGSYWVFVGNSLACLSPASDTVTVAMGDAVALSAENITLFPNPNDGDFFLRLPPLDGTLLEIRIYDMHGKSLFNLQLEIHDCQQLDIPFSFNNLASGIYFMQLIEDDKEINLKFEVRW